MTYPTSLVECKNCGGWFPYPGHHYCVGRYSGVGDVYSAKEPSDCMHDNCPTCNGTGIRQDGLSVCIHNISCPCPKCTTR